jgi:hypothetical protein
MSEENTVYIYGIKKSLWKLPIEVLLVYPGSSTIRKSTFMRNSLRTCRIIIETQKNFTDELDQPNKTKEDQESRIIEATTQTLNLW